jgi:hypothetical protein
VQLVDALCYKQVRFPLVLLGMRNQKFTGDDDVPRQTTELINIPSGCTMALDSTEPLTEMSTKNISWWVKAADGYG